MQSDTLTILSNEILACACECLNTHGSCPCPCRIFISAGPPVGDLEACCSDGQLSIHTERLYTYGRFPSEQGLINTCASPLAAEMVVTLFRCFPAVKDDGSAPTGDEIGAASEAIYQDLYVMTKCIICNLASRSPRQQSVFRGSRVLQPEGGCIRGEIRFVTQIPEEYV